MYKYIKRFLDILISLILLSICGIPMLIIALCIKLEDGGSVFYKSFRMGKGLKPFEMYKFRSMIENRKELEGKLTHDQMVTKVGKFIRKTSLDELPQLLNVLKGEMSFIGPRPWILSYYDWMTKQQKRRVSVTPGITGLAQVRGRNGISVLQKIAYDIEYVENFGFKYDLKVFFESIKVVLKKESAEITEDGIKEELNVLKNNKAKKKKAKVK